MEDATGALVDDMDNILHRLDSFRKRARECSSTFAFWDEYLAMIESLLDYIAAERNCDFDKHLHYFMRMLPYDFAFDHTNYARWGSIYVAEMSTLSTLFPDVHTAMNEGLHTVRRSSNSSATFNGIWSDQAIEQTLNRDCSTEGTLKGMNRTAAAVEWHYLTSHSRAAVSSNLLTMCGLNEDTTYLHREISSNRTKVDEMKIHDVIQVIQETMTNPFNLDDDASVEDPMPLVNIATGVLLPSGVPTDSLLNARTTGRDKLEAFVSERINCDKVDIMAPIPKTGVRTFSSLRKPVKLT
ncbi:MAG: hypothetical protein ABW185_03330 [Sedimenticola sp.]